VKDCTFCRIERGELPADLLYQDEGVIAFKDIAPRAPFHVLVVPRKHIASVAETDDEALLGHLVRVAATLAKDAGLRRARLSGADQHRTRGWPGRLPPALARVRRPSVAAASARRLMRPANVTWPLIAS